MKNSSIESDKRKSFDDIIDFNVIFAQNIYFFDVANDVANKIKIDKIIENVENEINDEVTNDFETSSLNIDFSSFVANLF